MESDVFLINQLVNSMGDAADKLEYAKNTNNFQEFNKIKFFILDLQRKIEREADKI
jgi:hypothetical protein